MMMEDQGKMALGRVVIAKSSISWAQHHYDLGSEMSVTSAKPRVRSDAGWIGE